MDRYFEIQLRPDPEFTPHQLLSGLYARLHRALAFLNSRDIGVSFPDYGTRLPVTVSDTTSAPAARTSTGPRTLGNRLRLHGSEHALQRLISTTWLNGMIDHVIVSAATPAPGDATHCRFVRVQAKSSPSRLRRRAARRHNLDAETAAERIPDSAAERLQLPFVIIGSRSTGQPSFPLFIRQETIQTQAVDGFFNAYGLSHSATVPWF